MKQRPLVERQHPIFSPVALVATLILLIIMFGFIYISGGMMFSPGELSAQGSGRELGGVTTHADIQQDCHACHAPWQGVKANLCEDCHANITTQRTEGNGLHGGFAVAEDCVLCHSEHHGADFDLTTEGKGFDHEKETNFSLKKHQADYNLVAISCTDCHADDTTFPQKPTSCTACHTAEAPEFMADHTLAFGEGCLACHDGVDRFSEWTMEEDHRAFPLVGAHENVTCEGCHAGTSNPEQFTQTPTACADCHTPPDDHIGHFTEECSACHTTTAFLPATLANHIFNHQRDTHFSLDKHIQNFDETPFECRSCHLPDRFEYPDNGCIDCHASYEATFMAEHVAQFGEDCLACHDGTGRLTGFNHADIFPLDGAHGQIECADCHENQTFRGTPHKCVTCHGEPEIHFGLFGTTCQACHTTTAWYPAQLLIHTFPLDHGGEGQLACTKCHTGSYAVYTCTECHASDEMSVVHENAGISPLDLPNCIACHATGTIVEEP